MRSNRRIIALILVALILVALILVALILVALFWVVGCAVTPYCKTTQYDSYRIAMEDVLNMTCEDTTKLGYAQGYFGNSAWHEMGESFGQAVEKSKYGGGCGKYWGRWKGMRIYKDTQTNDGGGKSR